MYESFRTIVKGQPMPHFQRHSVSLPLPMIEDLKQEAARRDMSLSALVREYVRYGRLRDTQGGLDVRREGDSRGD